MSTKQVWARIILALLIAFAYGFWAGRATGTSAPDLSSKLPTVVGVSCAADQAEWTAETSRYSLPATVNGYTEYTNWTVHLAPWVCASLRSNPTSAYLLTLYHEYVHAALHTRTESQAECVALFLYRYWLRRFWGYTIGQAQELYEGAWGYHLLKPAEYQGTCAFEAKDNISPLNGF